MTRIKLLPQVVQNKIAAGEVVERPFAVVKELVENSIDAGASTISIELEEGGKKLIRVVDNGNGIAKDDLILAVMQHATSKISSAEELFSVKTMGFRGEALASIASVSQFTLTSRQKGFDAFCLNVEGGVCGEVKPASSSNGTIVEARNLFFNTPVRLKFMKTDSAELAKISEIISCIALAYPEIGFQLSHNGKLIFQLPEKQDTTDRIHLLLPLNLAEGLIEIPEFNGGFFKITGYLGSPYLARPRRDHQYLFVNKRVVKDKLLQGVISKIYEGLIPNGKYPVVVLFLDIDPSEVDVNVHPTKFEVRFAQSGSIFSAIMSLGKDLLQPKQVPLSNTMKEINSFENYAKSNSGYFTSEFSGQSKPVFSKSNFNSPQFDSGQIPNSVIKNDQTLDDALVALKKIYEPISTTKIMPMVAEEQSTLDFGIKPPFAINNAQVQYEKSKKESEVSILPFEGNVITIENTFLVSVIENHIVMLDQHALHERMQFEKLKKSLSTGSFGSQQLIVPVTLSISEVDKQQLFEHLDELEKLGLQFEDFGPGLISIKGIPVDVPNLDVEVFFHELLKNFEWKQSSDLEGARYKICATMACHSSLRAGDKLLQVDKINLMKYAWANKELLTCPHGRPTIKIISPKELARFFHRA